MLDGGALSPQGKDQELVLGLGHRNNSYNFSVSVQAPSAPPLPTLPAPQSWGGAPQAEAPSPLSTPATQFHVVIGSRAEEGQYSLSFHNCYNLLRGQERPFDITVSGTGGRGPGAAARAALSLASPGPPSGRAV